MLNLEEFHFYEMVAIIFFFILNVNVRLWTGSNNSRNLNVFLFTREMYIKVFLKPSFLNKSHINIANPSLIYKQECNYCSG